MRIWLALTVTLFLFATGVSVVKSQENKSAKVRPNLNGVWIMDKSKSEATEYGFTLDLDMTLTIVQKEPEITITRVYTHEGTVNRQELRYFSNGRGETNPTIIGEVFETKTKWIGDKLVSKGSGQTEIGPRLVVLYERADEWKLSKDGNTLEHITRIYNARSPRGQPLLTTDNQNVPPLFGRAETRRVFRKSAQN